MTTGRGFELRTGGNRNVPPQTLALGHLTETDGPELDMLCNCTRDIARAVHFCKLFEMSGSKYARDIADYLKCMSVSKDGEGRKSLIDVVKAGGELPGEYYQSKAFNMQELLDEDGDGTQEQM